MIEANPPVSERAAELRREFDRSFAAPAAVDTAAGEDLLAIRLGGKAFAIRMIEIGGLFADKKITPVPGANAALLGIAGFRGTIVPVYDLRRLVEHSPSESSRWLIVAAAELVAYAFETFEGQLRVSPDAIKPEQGDDRSGLSRDFVQSDGVLRPIVQLASVLEATGT